MLGTAKKSFMNNWLSKNLCNIYKSIKKHIVSSRLVQKLVFLKLFSFFHVIIVLCIHQEEGYLSTTPSSKLKYHFKLQDMTITSSSNTEIPLQVLTLSNTPSSKPKNHSKIQNLSTTPRLKT